MKMFLISVLVAFSLPVLAQEDAGIPVEVQDAGGLPVDAGVSQVDAGILILADGGFVIVNPESINDLTPLVTVTKSHIQNGNWFSAVSGILVILIGLFRMFAKKLHELIPDENPIDKFFWFMLETNVGGWITNFLTTTSLGIASVLLVGEPITWAILKPILGLSLTMAGIVKLVKDVWDWIQKKIDAKKEVPAAPPASPEA